LRVNDVSKAYALTSLITDGVVIDALGEIPLVLISSGRQVNVEGTTLLGEDVIFSAGVEARAYERGTQTLSPGPQEGRVLDSSGKEWQVTEYRIWAGVKAVSSFRTNGIYPDHYDSHLNKTRDH
jgi:hypothetical protein